MLLCRGFGLAYNTVDAYVLLAERIRRCEYSRSGLPAGYAVIPVYAKELRQFLPSVKVVSFTRICNGEAGIDAPFTVWEIIKLLKDVPACIRYKAGGAKVYKQKKVTICSLVTPLAVSEENSDSNHRITMYFDSETSFTAY